MSTRKKNGDRVDERDRDSDDVVRLPAPPDGRSLNGDPRRRTATRTSPREKKAVSGVVACRTLPPLPPLFSVFPATQMFFMFIYR